MKFIEKIMERKQKKEPKPMWHLFLPPGFMKFKKRGRWVYGSLLVLVIGLLTYLVFPRPDVYMASQSKEESVEFLAKEEGKYGTFVSQTYEGHGQIGKDEFEVFNVVTTTGKYNFVYGAQEDNPNKFSTVAIYQQAPETKWIFNEMVLVPQVAVAFYTMKDEVGTPKKEATSNTVETDKGTVTYTVVNSEVTGIFLDGKKKNLPELTLDVQERTQKFIEEQGELTGKLLNIADYEWTKEKQSYFVVAEEGLFRMDEYHTGKAEILKGEVDYTPTPINEEIEK